MFKTLLLERHLTHMQAGLYAMLAYMLFSLSDGFAKYLMAEGYARSHILIMTNIPSFICLSIFMIYRKGLSRAFHTPHPWLHVGRVFGLLGVTYFGFIALQKLPLADFYGIIFSTPLVMTITAFLFFKERVSLTEIIAIIIGFSGILIVAQPDLNNFNIGYLYAFLAVLSVTTAGLFIRKMGHGEDAYLYVIFANLGIIIANIIPATYSESVVTISINHVITFLIYCFTIPCAILVLSAVFARAPTMASVASFQYTQIIWGSLFGFVVFNHIPNVNTVIGSSVVITCGLYILIHHRRKKRYELGK